jgi:hypothetical protein
LPVLRELGCPRGPTRTLGGAFERFEHGQMIWRGDDRTILVLLDTGAWQRFADHWQEGQPTADANLVPPPSLLQPERGFGKVWREQLGGPAAATGWATEPEEAITGTVQDWDNGFLIRYGEAHMAFLNVGIWR